MPSPSRVSDPMSRMLTASVASGAWVGRSVPIAVETSTFVMFVVSRQAAKAVPPTATTRAVTTPMTAQDRQVRRGRPWMSRRRTPSVAAPEPSPEGERRA